MKFAISHLSAAASYSCWRQFPKRYLNWKRGCVGVFLKESWSVCSACLMCSNESCGLGPLRWGAVLAFLALNIWALYALWQLLRSVGFHLHVPPKAVVPHLKAEPVSCWMKLVGGLWVCFCSACRDSWEEVYAGFGQLQENRQHATQQYNPGYPASATKMVLVKKELANVEGINWTSPCVHDVWDAVQAHWTQTKAFYQIVVWVVLEQSHWSNLRSKGK